MRSLKDKTFKVTFETNELTPEQLMGLGSSLNKFGYIAFKEDPFKQSEKEAIDNLEADYHDNSKSPSQRLRGVLYRLWEQNNKGYQDFNRYYDFIMDMTIRHYKSKLE